MNDFKCYFDVAINGRDHGRIVFNLYKDKCPKTCENFRCLCTGERGLSNVTKVPLHYKGSKIHRIVRDFIVQGGDITDGNGRGGDSIYGGSFDDEDLSLKHDRPYLLSMANRGPNTNRSQFFITTSEAPHLDGKHVVFGQVSAGFSTIDKIERLEVDSNSRPLQEVTIKDCGQLLGDNELPFQYRISQNDEKKRKPSTSSRSSCDTRVIRRHHKVVDRSRSSSSTSCTSNSSHHSSYSCSSGSSSRSLSRTSSSSLSSSPTPSRKRKRSSRDRCSISSDSKSDRVSPTNVHSKRKSRSRRRENRSRSCSISSDEASKSGSEIDHKQKTRKNRRLKTSRRIESKKSEISPKDKKINGASDDEYVNPHYKCSIKLDEIPEVPMNRFLMRVSDTSNRSPNKRSKRSSSDVSEAPIDIDMSKFEDLPDDMQSSSGPSRVIKSLVKAPEPLVSKSGRIMKGRGTFKFCTPSPESSPKSRKTSKHSYRRSRYDDNWNSRRSRNRRSRSRSRSYDRTVPRYHRRSPERLLKNYR